MLEKTSSAEDRLERSPLLRPIPYPDRKSRATGFSGEMFLSWRADYGLR